MQSPPMNDESTIKHSLTEAAKNGDAETLAHLLSRSGSTAVVNDLNRSLLSIAAEQGHEECVKILLDYRTEVDFYDIECDTPLSLAAAGGHTSCVAMLIAAGADINNHSPNGTPLIQAALHADVDTVRMLLEAGANPNASCSYGATALGHAMERGNADCARLLLASGATLNGADEFGYDETMLAVRGGNEECIQLILAAGGNPYYVGKARELALLEAVHDDDVETVQHLLEQGADVNIRNAHGRTPLFLALQYATPNDCLPLLLNSGVDESIRDIYGETAWEYAATEGCLSRTKLTPDELKKQL